MRKTITLILFAITAMVFTSCGPTKEEAIKYNDKIINEQVEIINKINKLYDALKNYEDHYGMDFTYAEALKQLETGTAAVEKLDKFGGNTEFRDGALKLFGTYKSVLQNELKKMIDISKLSDDMYTTEVEAEFNNLADISTKKMDEGLNELNAIQQKFADKYKFQIEKKKDY
jgi:hypothetical protein